MDGKSQITARWIKSSRIGICIEEYGEGVVYYGFTKNQKKNGVGILMLSNGLIATGSWIENFIEGPMLSLSHLGTAYLGNCVHQVYSGFADIIMLELSFINIGMVYSTILTILGIMANDLVEFRVNNTIHNYNINNLHPFQIEHRQTMEMKGRSCNNTRFSIL